MWVTIRKSLEDQWEPPMNLGPLINTPEHDYSPCISFDGNTLYFTYNPGGADNGDIWKASIAPISTSPDFNLDGKIDLVDFSMISQD